jgi:hypothetical protein
MATSQVHKEKSPGIPGGAVWVVVLEIRMAITINNLHKFGYNMIYSNPTIVGII